MDCAEIGLLLIICGWVCAIIVPSQIDAELDAMYCVKISLQSRLD